MKLAEGKLEVLMFELRNLIGMKPEEPLRLRGDFSKLIDQLPASCGCHRTRAARTAPTSRLFMPAENFAIARIEQARSAGRLDASVSGGLSANEFQLHAFRR